MQVLGEALALILVANSVPVLVRHIPLLERYEQPLDCKLRFVDGRPLFGASKTWRGILASMLVTSICAALLHMGWHVGLWVSVLAMTGDLVSSFSKRRLGLAPSDMALGLDQIPESLFPAIYLHYLWQLGWPAVFVLVAAFFVLELVLSRIMYRLHVRKRPY